MDERDTRTTDLPELQKHFEMCLGFVIETYFDGIFLLLNNLVENRYTKKIISHQNVNKLQIKVNYLLVMAPPKKIPELSSL